MFSLQFARVATAVSQRVAKKDACASLWNRPSALSPEPKPCDQSAVPAGVLPFDVPEEPAAPANELQQSPSAGVVALVLAEVLGQFVDTRCENSSLDFGGPCVVRMGSIILDYRCAPRLVQGTVYLRSLCCLETMSFKGF